MIYSIEPLYNDIVVKVWWSFEFTCCRMAFFPCVTTPQAYVQEARDDQVNTVFIKWNDLIICRRFIRVSWRRTLYLCTPDQDAAKRKLSYHNKPYNISVDIDLDWFEV